MTDTTIDAGKMSVIGYLFQARMWREYAQEWDSGSEWVKQILRVPRGECIRRCRENILRAHQANITALTGSEAANG